MNTVHITLAVVFLIIIVWVGGSMLADAWHGFKNNPRTIVTLGTAGWFHGAASLVYGQDDACITKAWPAGTQLRVYNSAGVFVDVVVVPEPPPFVASERVLLHLARPAFQKLAPIAINYLHVEVELLATAIERESYRAADKEGVRG
jgi:hypothetical protein